MPVRSARTILLAIASAVLIAPAAHAGKTKPGDPIPTGGGRDIADVEESAPKDTRHYTRPAIRQDAEIAQQVLPAGWNLVDTVVANTDATLQNTDTAGDSEPSL